MSEYSEGFCDDGAAILKDGVMLTVSEIVRELNQLRAEKIKLYKALELSVRQNSHDMLLTGEEIRRCEAALAKARGEIDHE